MLVIVLLHILQRWVSGSPGVSVNATQKAYAASHEFRPASLQDFLHLNLVFYDQTQAWMEGHGFRFLGDVEDARMPE